mgnify:CR=1 FL=1
MTLNKIAWSFTNKTYSDAEKFNNAVTEYQIDIKENSDEWKPTKIVSDFPEIEIQYMAWVKSPEDLLENEALIEDDEDAFDDEPEEEAGYQVEIVAKLTADNGANFTALEFLMKTHNQLANKELGDSTFFEGVEDNSDHEDELPLYYISCGS